MGLFRKIVRTTIIGREKGITQEEKSINYAVGHMMGGFDGVVRADILNDSYPDKVTFKIFYDDGSSGVDKVEVGSLSYRTYMKYLNK